MRAWSSVTHLKRPSGQFAVWRIHRLNPIAIKKKKQLSLSALAPMKPAAMLRAAPWRGPGGQGLKVTTGPQPEGKWSLSSQFSFEATASLANTLIAALGETLSWRAGLNRAGNSAEGRQYVFSALESRSLRVSAVPTQPAHCSWRQPRMTLKSMGVNALSRQVLACNPLV